MVALECRERRVASVLVIELVLVVELGLETMVVVKDMMMGKAS